VTTIVADTASTGTATPAASWVVGIDLSLTSTAVAALHTGTGDLYVHRVRSVGKASDSLLAKVGRYTRLSQEIAAAALISSPALVTIEGAQFATQKDTSAHRRAGLWWRVVELIIEAGVPVVEVPVSTVKKWGTGRGNASKDMMLAAAVRRWDQVSQNDEADAAWLADIAAYHLGTAVVSRTKSKDSILSKLGSLESETRQPSPPVQKS